MKVFIDSHLHITEYTDEQATIIKGDLRKDNPAFHSAELFSPYKRIAVPKYLYYYKENKKKRELVVPRGYKIPFDYEVTGEATIKNPDVDYPEFCLELRNAQKSAVGAYHNSQHNDAMIVMPTGSGKAQPLDTKILTPDGYVLMRDIKIWDLVIGEDGNFYPVSGVFPQGMKHVYELTFKDGTTTRSCSEHLWKYATFNMCKTSKGKRWKVAELQEILKAPLKYLGNYNFNIPVNKPIQYSHREVVIPPYALGLLIGDGCLTLMDAKCSNIYFSNTEQDIINRLNEELGDLGVFCKNTYTDCQYVFRTTDTPKRESRLVKELKRLGINCTSGERFLPKEYLFNSTHVRLELLKGLFDTDGSVQSNGSYEFTTVSWQLAEDIQQLCRSLGYRTTLSTFDRRGRERIVKGKAYSTNSLEYVVRILTHDEIFKSNKHKERNTIARSKHRKAQEHRYDRLSVVSVKYIGELPCQCIMVDSEDHTYLCDDFIVTHNTVTGLYLTQQYKQKTLIVVNKDDLIAGWRDDAKLCFGDKFKCGLIKAKKFEIGEFITLATIQTLCKLPSDKLEEVKKTFGMVIVDEQHRSASKSYEFISNLPAHRRVGFTATDIRNDGLRDVLDFYFRGVVYRCDDNAVKEDIITSEGIEVITRPSDIVYRVPKSYRWVDDNTLVTAIEWLNPRKIITNKDKEWAEAIKELLRDGEIAKIPINLHKVNAFVNADEKFMDTVVSDIVSECRLNRSCVVFCKEKALVEKLNDLLLEKGFDNEDILMYYGNSKVTKEDLKERAETKKSLITLTTLAMATEGTNVKAWESIFLVSSIANEKDLIQAIGRVRRTKEGKDLVKIFDYSHPSVDGLKRHSAVRMAYYEKKGFRIK